VLPPFVPPKPKFHNVFGRVFKVPPKARRKRKRRRRNTWGRRQVSPNVVYSKKLRMWFLVLPEVNNHLRNHDIWRWSGRRIGVFKGVSPNFKNLLYPHEAMEDRCHNWISLYVHLCSGYLVLVTDTNQLPWKISSLDTCLLNN